MKYLTGMQALNLPCSLNTTGDWHSGCMRWDQPELSESDVSVWKDYGIEHHSTSRYPVANHIRACLDLIASGQFGLAKGMRKDYICTDEYDDEIFDKVLSLKSTNRWEEVDSFMGKEYLMKWIRYKQSKREKYD